MPKKITIVGINQGPLPENEEVKEAVVEEEVEKVEEVVEPVENRTRGGKSRNANRRTSRR